MVKDDQTVIEYVSLCIGPSQPENVFITDAWEFGELVNMTADELEAWLKEEQSQTSGWSKDDGSEETVGHER